MDDTTIFVCKYCGTEVEVEIELLGSIDLRCPECSIYIETEDYGEEIQGE